MNTSYRKGIRQLALFQSVPLNQRSTTCGRTRPSIMKFAAVHM